MASDQQYYVNPQVSVTDHAGKARMISNPWFIATDREAEDYLNQAHREGYELVSVSGSGGSHPLFVFRRQP